MVAADIASTEDAADADVAVLEDVVDAAVFGFN